jgi:YfiH family protein
MINYKEKYKIFFGDSNSCNVDYKTTEFDGFSRNFASKYSLHKILFNKQVHGASGFVIDSARTVAQFRNINLEGDFLITNQKNIGIGVLTGDCLPVLFYDRKNSVAAAIHAGWRSAVLGICKIAFEAMQNRFGTRPQDLDVFLGPCAKACCYEVQPDFLSNLKQFAFKEQLIQEREARLFFDNVLLNRLLLEEIGVASQKINCNYNLCTICNCSFNSYRRDAQTKLRQISFIAFSD